MDKQELRNEPAEAAPQGSQQPSGEISRPGGRPSGYGATPFDLFRLSPFSLMRRMSDEIDRVFGEVGVNRSEVAKTGWVPAIEVSEQSGNFVVRAELPGVNTNDVKVEITDDAVVIEGERKSERTENREGVRHSEHHYGRFYRSVPLPEGAKVDQARAKAENGVLEISVPLETQKSKPRQIQVEQSGQQSSTISGKAA